jgi:hypothetical protein
MDAYTVLMVIAAIPVWMPVSLWTFGKALDGACWLVWR